MPAISETLTLDTVFLNRQEFKNLIHSLRHHFVHLEQLYYSLQHRRQIVLLSQLIDQICVLF
jgi:hypothetical protein